jgi:hypothetical protein
LKENGFGSLDEAVEFQKRSVGDDRFRIVDLAAQSVWQTDATYQSMRWRYSVILDSHLMRVGAGKSPPCLNHCHEIIPDSVSK